MSTLHDFTATTLQGREQQLSDYAGKIVVVVNTASRCGLTPQFEGLQKIYDDYRDRGLVVLGFPCDQFAHQEPGSADEIGEFCTMNYGVTFPMFAKVDVNGSEAHPLWKWLRQEQGGCVDRPDLQLVQVGQRAQRTRLLGHGVRPDHDLHAVVAETLGQREVVVGVVRERAVAAAIGERRPGPAVVERHSAEGQPDRADRDLVRLQADEAGHSAAAFCAP